MLQNGSSCFNEVNVIRSHITISPQTCRQIPQRIIKPSVVPLKVEVETAAFSSKSSHQRLLYTQFMKRLAQEQSGKDSQSSYSMLSHPQCGEIAACWIAREKSVQSDGL